MFQPETVKGFTFPDDQNIPTQTLQIAHTCCVSPYIHHEFLVPVLFSSLGSRRPSTTLMPMPKAAMDENDLLHTGKNEVRSARQISAMEPSTMTKSVNRAAHSHLGLAS